MFASVGASVEASCNAAIAKKFLTDILANGPVLVIEIEDAANANGISRRTLERAKRELGVIAVKNGQWFWRLPEAAKVATT